MEWKDSRKEKPADGGYGVLYAIKRNVQLDLFSDSQVGESSRRETEASVKVRPYAFAFYNPKNGMFEIFTRCTESGKPMERVDYVKNAMYAKIDVL